MTLGRRTFIGGLASLAIVPATARAGERCAQGNAWQPPYCIAEVDLAEVIYAYRDQNQSLWCWAAVTEMIFAYYGYDVPQEQIVERVYGAHVNLPAMTTSTISAVLSADWVDTSGRAFSCRLRGLFDVFTGTNALNNVGMINALQNDMPLYYCNLTHAMVLTAVGYFHTPMGPNVNTIGLIDPWPGMGARGPQPAELVPAPLGGALTYVALPQVTPL